uniref:Helicase-associated domain-containing protein n=1 Tax=Romanomermis culicivorax TaxID=13658 RepID=A0A915JG55_ROMCU
MDDMCRLLIILEQHSTPEILRTPLHEIALSIKLLKLGSIGDFLAKAIQPPPVDAVIESEILLKVDRTVPDLEFSKGYLTGQQHIRYRGSSLESYSTEMNALDQQSELTPLGRILARLPIEPVIGKTIVLAAIFGIPLNIQHDIAAKIVALRCCLDATLIRATKNPESLTTPSEDNKKLRNVLIKLSSANTWWKNEQGANVPAKSTAPLISSTPHHNESVHEGAPSEYDGPAADESTGAPAKMMRFSGANHNSGPFGNNAASTFGSGPSNTVQQRHHEGYLGAAHQRSSNFPRGRQYNNVNQGNFGQNRGRGRGYGNYNSGTQNLSGGYANRGNYGNNGNYSSYGNRRGGGYTSNQNISNNNRGGFGSPNFQNNGGVNRGRANYANRNYVGGNNQNFGRQNHSFSGNDLNSTASNFGSSSNYYNNGGY